MNPWRSLGDLPREVWLVCLAALVNRLGTMLLPFFTLYATVHLRLSVSEAGLLLATYGAVSLVAAPLGGRLCDRFGPVPVLRASLLLSGVVLCVFPLATTFEWVVVAMVAWALPAELARPASLTAVGAFATAGRSRQAFAALRLAINLGMSIGPALGGLLAQVSFGWLCVVDGVTSLLGALVLCWPGLRFPAQPAAMPAAGGARVRVDRRLWLVLAAVVPIAIVFFQHEGPMPLTLVHELGLSEASYGLLFTLNTLIILFLEVWLNAATAHWPMARALGLGAALTGLGFGALAVAWDLWSVAATVVVWTFGEMILFPGLSAYVSELAPADRRGAYMGLYTMAWGVAFTVGPVLGNYVYEHAGSTAVWLGCLGFAAVSTLLLVRLPPVTATPEAQPPAAP